MSGPDLTSAPSVSTGAAGARPRLVNPYATIVISIILDAAAQVCLKIGADHSVEAGSLLGITGLRSPWVWAGIVMMVTGLGTWLYSLRFVPLNIASNLTGSVHVLVPLSCWMLLGEKISAGRWVGIALVIAGVFVIARPLTQVEEKMEDQL